MLLIVNPGSSSIKFQLYNVQNSGLTIKAKGIAERIGVDGQLKIESNGHEKEWHLKMSNHFEAVQHLISAFEKLKLIEDKKEIQGIGFRVVHGSSKITRPIIITPSVEQVIRDASKLAPLHNPSALVTIEAFEKALPNAPLVAVFDTAFHQTIPEVNFLYPVPYDWYKNHEVRKYGFHGISYEFITQKMGEILGKPINKLNLIICHLGNGASIAAIKNGKSFDTTMGLTPLAGLMMGTRSGNIDPSILAYMGQELNLNAQQITDILNKKSGLLGMSKLSSDMRDIEEKMRQKEKLPTLAFEKYTQTVADYVVEMANKIGTSIDAIVFTAGIGENSDSVRKSVIQKLPLLHLEINEVENKAKYSEWKKISSPKSMIPIYAVRTNEELMIAQETLKLIK